MTYIPLRTFSLFSTGFGTIHNAQILDFCTQNNIPAIGLTDHNTLGGAQTLNTSLCSRGIQPIIGLTLDVSHEKVDGTLVMLARNQAGWDALLRLSGARNTSAGHVVTLSDVARHLGEDAASVIALTGGPDGLIERIADRGRKIFPVCSALLDIFGAGNLYMELQRPNGAPGSHEALLKRAADHVGIPLVASNEAHYPGQEDMSAQDAFLCITDKTFLVEDNRRKARPGCYLVSPEDMAARFADIPEAIENTAEIARRCSFMLEVQAPKLPVFPTEDDETEADALRRMARSGLTSRLDRITVFDNVDEQSYRNRLETELDIISSMGFPGYFLIVADFISWARGASIPVGPGRGSGAGSLVAWALGITNIDPIRFGLIFERFLNPERVSMPDFDIDICQERRDDVIDYVRRKYGADCVARIGSFNTIKARSAVRDTARVMQIPYGIADQFASMIPQNPSNPITLSEAMEEDGLREAIEQSDDIVQDMFRIAVQLEGLYRSVGTHAAGIIISDRPIADVVPVHLDQDSKLATSYEMKAVEKAGLVKFDFLGLKSLDIIDGAKRFIEQTHGRDIPDLDNRFDDAETYADLAKGDGFAVFQLESAGMRQAMRDLDISNIEELIALISLYRPGPMDQIPLYASVKKGEETVHYAHPEMRDVLEPTNGVMIYQEQVMEIARRLAGYTMGEADLLRRAMGKKIQSEMEDQKTRFQQGASAGWAEIVLDDGTRHRVHAMSRFPALDGTGRLLTLQEAVESGVEVAI